MTDTTKPTISFDLNLSVRPEITDPVIHRELSKIYNSLTIAANHVPANRQTIPYTGSLNLGDPVNLYSNAGALTGKLADASIPAYADGFVIAKTPTTVEISFIDQNIYLTGLTIGSTYYLANGGGYTTVAPANVQVLGKALAANILYFNRTPK